MENKEAKDERKLTSRKIETNRDRKTSEVEE